MPPVVNVHTHPRPAPVLSIVEPYGTEMTTRDGAWYLRSVSGRGDRFAGERLERAPADPFSQIGCSAAERLSRIRGA